MQYNKNFVLLNHASTKGKMRIKKWLGTISFENQLKLVAYA